MNKLVKLNDINLEEINTLLTEGFTVNYHINVGSDVYVVLYRRHDHNLPSEGMVTRTGATPVSVPSRY